MAAAPRLESALGVAAAVVVGVDVAAAAGVVPGTGGYCAVVATVVEIAAIAQELRQSAVEWGAGPGHSR